MSEQQKDTAAQLYNEADVKQDNVKPDEAAKSADTTAKPDQEKPADKAAPEVKPQPESEKKADEQKTETVVPEKYDLKLPEKSHLQASDVDKIAVYAKERGLSNDQAQELLNRENEAVGNFITSEQSRLEELTQKEWVSQIRADKEIGGDGYAKNIEMAKRVVSKFADQKLIDELESTGFGNHPELVRMLVRVGKQMSEDSLVLPGARPAKKEVSMEELFYGKQT